MRWINNLVTSARVGLIKALGGNVPAEETSTAAPSQASSASRTPGVTCPECATHFTVEIEALLQNRGLKCPNCGLVLHVNKEESASALESLAKLNHALSKAAKKS